MLQQIEVYKNHISNLVFMDLRVSSSENTAEGGIFYSSLTVALENHGSAQHIKMLDLKKSVNNWLHVCSFSGKSYSEYVAIAWSTYT